MLDERTIEANEESFVIVLQHGGKTSHENELYIGQSTSNSMVVTPKSDYRERTGTEWLVLGLGWG